MFQLSGFYCMRTAFIGRDFMPHIGSATKGASTHKAQWTVQNCSPPVLGGRPLDG